MVILSILTNGALVLAVLMGIPAGLWCLCKRLGVPCEWEDLEGKPGGQ